MLTCVGWQIKLCDPIWPLTHRSSEAEFRSEKLYALFYRAKRSIARYCHDKLSVCPYLFVCL